MTDQGDGSTKPHIVVINRWREQYARYAEYTDHATHHVTYISTEVGLSSVPEAAADVVLVDRTDDLESVRAATRLLAARYGPPQGIVTLKEDDLLVAAALREEWGCPGPRTEFLEPFRDKYLMATAVAEAGLDVPDFALAPDRRTVVEFGREHGWPLVVKPTRGSCSEGVVRLDGPEDVPRLAFTGEPLLVQRFQAGRIYHVDGVFTGTELLHWTASRYVNTCLGFRTGNFLGSVEEDDATVLAAIGAHAVRVLAALTGQATVFHLEVFVDTVSGRPHVSFLEVGARVGGAEIAFVWREVHGYDLMNAAFQLQLERPLPSGAPRRDREFGGYLLIPAPAARPCRITEVTPMSGRAPGPYAEALLGVGEVLPLADAYYEHVGGRFRFRGRDSEEVESALRATATGFRVSAVAVPVAETVAA
ncbi:acetyl-CoA carboxylase biotin carboxylase subunit family protein [Streptomyces sp. NPDC056948]|uniref:ATP-grasp domain-containing protein n=1 Tax=Streptomyces sp. NPDC056948 TaxID=3345975 RepID=UPI00362DB013